MSDRFDTEKVLDFPKELVLELNQRYDVPYHVIEMLAITCFINSGAAGKIAPLYEIVKYIRKKHRVDLYEDNAYFVFYPREPWDILAIHRKYFFLIRISRKAPDIEKVKDRFEKLVLKEIPRPHNRNPAILVWYDTRDGQIRLDYKIPVEYRGDHIGEEKK